MSVNNFKENLKWDVIASKYALLYQQVLGTEEKLQVVSNPSSRVAPKSK
jgi:hypothetical protein